MIACVVLIELSLSFNGLKSQTGLRDDFGFSPGRPRSITVLRFSGQAGELFTSVLYNLYVAPEGFCFDAFCNDDPILDNPKHHGYNVHAKVI